MRSSFTWLYVAMRGCLAPASSVRCGRLFVSRPGWPVTVFSLPLPMCKRSLTENLWGANICTWHVLEQAHCGQADVLVLHTHWPQSCVPNSNLYAIVFPCFSGIYDDETLPLFLLKTVLNRGTEGGPESPWQPCLKGIANSLNTKVHADGASAAYCSC